MTSSGEGLRALIIVPFIEDGTRKTGTAVDEAAQTEEAAGLAGAINLAVVAVKTFRVRRVSPGYLIGKGNREEIATLVQAHEPDVVIVNHALSPVQQRNLEKDWKAKVIDRTGLILEIFGARAQSREGKIQVELAALEYQRSRLVRSWTHLERQRGGLGKTGGPGETQIELDRRLITDRIARLRRDLADVVRARALQRRSREKEPFPIIALIGYTNAGKSTLFNKLTGAGVFAEDLLFATLDTTMRRLKLPDGRVVLLSDTVGFISDLPTTLIAAFRATLEELQYADIILHVRDISRRDHDRQKQDVIAVLRDLNIVYEEDARIIEIWNKIDLLSEDEREEMARKAVFTDGRALAVSARDGQGTDALLGRLEQILAQSLLDRDFFIPAADGKALSWLHQNATVLRSVSSGDITRVSCRISDKNLGRFIDRFAYHGEDIV